MSDDLIRREDAIKAVEERSFAVRDSYTVKAILRNVPSADRPNAVDLSSVYSTAYKSGYEKGKADRPQGEWIPCSERLPKKAGHYLCSFKKANRIDSIYVDLAYWTGGRWYGYLANEINAWMPLPKPWKGEGR